MLQGGLGVGAGLIAASALPVAGAVAVGAAAPAAITLGLGTAWAGINSLYRGFGADYQPKYKFLPARALEWVASRPGRVFRWLLGLRSTTPNSATPLPQKVGGIVGGAWRWFMDGFKKQNGSAAKH
jgi:hypothetical protein